MLDRAHDAKFDAQYEKMLKDKGLPVSKQTVKKWTSKQLQPKNIQDYVTLKISLPAEEDAMRSSEDYGKSNRSKQPFEI